MLFYIIPAISEDRRKGDFSEGRKPRDKAKCKASEEIRAPSRRYLYTDGRFLPFLTICQWWPTYRGYIWENTQTTAISYGRFFRRVSTFCHEEGGKGPGVWSTVESFYQHESYAKKVHCLLLPPALVFSRNDIYISAFQFICVYLRLPLSPFVSSPPKSTRRGRRTCTGVLSYNAERDVSRAKLILRDDRNKDRNIIRYIMREIYIKRV